MFVPRLKSLSNRFCEGHSIQQTKPNSSYYGFPIHIYFSHLIFSLYLPSPKLCKLDYDLTFQVVYHTHNQLEYPGKSFGSQLSTTFFPDNPRALILLREIFQITHLIQYATALATKVSINSCSTSFHDKWICKIAGRYGVISIPDSLSGKPREILCTPASRTCIIYTTLTGNWLDDKGSSCLQLTTLIPLPTPDASQPYWAHISLLPNL